MAPRNTPVKDEEKEEDYRKAVQDLKILLCALIEDDASLSYSLATYKKMQDIAEDDKVTPAIHFGLLVTKFVREKTPTFVLTKVKAGDEDEEDGAQELRQLMRALIVDKYPLTTYTKLKGIAEDDTITASVEFSHLVSTFARTKISGSSPSPIPATKKSAARTNKRGSVVANSTEDDSDDEGHSLISKRLKQTHQQCKEISELANQEGKPASPDADADTR